MHLMELNSHAAWMRVVWNRASLPRHCTLFWLIMHGRLKVLQRLKRFRSDLCTDCPFCLAHEESIDHLLFYCAISTAVRQQVFSWLHISFQPTNFTHLIRWLINFKKGKVWNSFIRAACAALFYFLWQARNSSLDMFCQM